MTRSRPQSRPESQRSEAATRSAGEPTESRDLVGWSLSSPLRHNRRLSAAVARKVLATELGIDAAQLDAVDAESLRTAMRRLRGLVAECERLASAAAMDDLTGTLRRGTGITALQREIARAHRVGGDGLAVAFMDVDGLKHVNDTAGHAAGDQLLREVAAAIRERVRSYDLVFRYGGDEFVCALVDVTLEQARRTVDDILGSVRERSGGHTVSVGFASVGADDTAESVLERADAALYLERAASETGPVR
jgi:diguanylate cyclase (GGDEF)-like protein